MEYPDPPPPIRECESDWNSGRCAVGGLRARALAAELRRRRADADAGGAASGFGKPGEGGGATFEHAHKHAQQRTSTQACTTAHRHTRTQARNTQHAHTHAQKRTDKQSTHARNTRANKTKTNTKTRAGSAHDVCVQNFMSVHVVCNATSCVLKPGCALNATRVYRKTQLNGARKIKRESPCSTVSYYSQNIFTLCKKRFSLLLLFIFFKTPFRWSSLYNNSKRTKSERLPSSRTVCSSPGADRGRGSGEARGALRPCDRGRPSRQARAQRGGYVVAAKAKKK